MVGENWETGKNQKIKYLQYFSNHAIF